jgi:hypothetical protein
MNVIQIRFRVKKKNDYIPIDFLDKIIAMADETKHSFYNCSYGKDDFFDIIFINKTLIDSMEIFNKNIYQSKSFYDMFGKDAFDIEVFEFFPIEWKWESKGKLELNKIKWNLGNVEYIRIYEENDK